VVSGLLWRGPSRRLFDVEKAGRVTMCTSPLLLEELATTLGYKRLADKVTLPVAHIVQRYRERCIVLPDIILPGKIFDDPNDNIVLGCALAHSARYVVTGDAHVLAVREFVGVALVTARQFLKEVMGERDEPEKG